MSTVLDRPERRQRQQSARATRRDHLDWTDPTASAAWLDDLGHQCDDAISVAEDQTAPIADRRLGRAEAKRLLAEAKASLTALLAFARRGLPGGA